MIDIQNLLLCCCCSFAKSCLTFCEPMDCGTPGFPVLHYLPEFAQIHWVSDPIQPSHPMPPSSPPALNLSQQRGLIHWAGSSNQVTKYWSFNFSISHSNENLELISFRINWLQSKGLSEVFSSTTIQRHQFFSSQSSLWSNSHIHTWLLEKP